MTVKFNKDIKDIKQFKQKLCTMLEGLTKEECDKLLDYVMNEMIIEADLGPGTENIRHTITDKNIIENTRFQANKESNFHEC